MNLKSLEIKVLPATFSDYPIIQNLARFYLYDVSRYCGFISEEWLCPEDGLYECTDFRDYFEDPTRKAYLVRVGKELGGFVLLNKQGKSATSDWNMGEFFIVSKFQGKGVAQYVAQEIWKMHKGLWEVAVIPENVKALTFWQKIISTFTKGQYSEKLQTVDYDKNQPQRYILRFNT